MITTEDQNNTIHRWLCSESPSFYICHCGATGHWNGLLKKIEVLEPVPESVYRRRHNID